MAGAGALGVSRTLQVARMIGMMWIATELTDEPGSWRGSYSRAAWLPRRATSAAGPTGWSYSASCASDVLVARWASRGHYRWRA